jgi:hypothetical protein
MCIAMLYAFGTKSMYILRAKTSSSERIKPRKAISENMQCFAEILFRDTPLSNLSRYLLFGRVGLKQPLKKCAISLCKEES